MSTDERRVEDLIRTAFRGVKLGNGVGLRQGRGLDNYAGAEALAKLRPDDEKDDWSAISFEDLNAYNGSLSFFDAEGMRFHLPAFLIQDLKGIAVGDLIFHLTCSGHKNARRFTALNADQRRAVREYLLLK